MQVRLRDWCVHRGQQWLHYGRRDGPRQDVAVHSAIVDVATSRTRGEGNHRPCRCSVSQQLSEGLFKGILLLCETEEISLCPTARITNHLHVESRREVDALRGE